MAVVHKCGCSNCISKVKIKCEGFFHSGNSYCWQYIIGSSVCNYYECYGAVILMYMSSEWRVSLTGSKLTVKLILMNKCAVWRTEGWAWLRKRN
jgi:hypothetical protein